MKPLAILTFLFLAPLLPGQDAAPSPPPALDQERDCTEPMIQAPRKLTNEQILMYASGLQLPDNPVQEMYPKYLEQKAEIEHLKQQGIGPAHPVMVTKERELQTLKEELDAAVVGLRDTLQANLDAANARKGPAADRLSELETVIRQFEGIMENLLKLKGDDLLKYVAGLGFSEPEINAGVPKYLDLKREFQQLVDQGLPPTHPRVVAKAKEIDALRKQLDQSVVALREVVQMHLELAGGRHKGALAARLREQQQDEAIRKVEESQDYIDAKRTYESEEDVLKLLELTLTCTPNPKDPITAGLQTAVTEQHFRVEQAWKAMASIMRERGTIHDDDDDAPPQPAPPSSPAANPTPAKPE